MNKLPLIGLVFALALPLTAMAETKDAPAADAAHAEHICKKLNITAPEQKEKVMAIFRTQREKMQALRDETRASLQAILTPEQMTTFDAMRDHHQQMRAERMGKNHPTKQ
jgi:Spy/CpxP family protein refolding chaperone